MLSSERLPQRGGEAKTLAAPDPGTVLLIPSHYNWGRVYTTAVGVSYQPAAQVTYRQACSSNDSRFSSLGIFPKEDFLFLDCQAVF